MNARNAKYTRIAKKLINELPELDYIRDAGVKVAFLSSDVEKKKDGRLIFADCTKVNKARYDWCCPFDFFITVYEPNILEFNEKQINALIEHELLHIGIREDGDEPSFYVVPHDIEEFWMVIERYGMDWQKKEDK